MNELATAYIEYLSKLKMVKKPAMPKFKIDAYNDYEYLLAIDQIMLDFDSVNDLKVTENFIKGDYGS